jgi:hypothetical protein
LHRCSPAVGVPALVRQPRGGMNDGTGSSTPIRTQ